MAARVCPFWVGYLLISPLRRWLHNPERILGPYVQAGMTVVDLGCAMGFFTIPMGRLVGPQGTVICVDVREKMLRVLQKRARKAGVAERLMTRLCVGNSLGLQDLRGRIDFALAFAVVHEVPDVPAFFLELSEALKGGATCLVAEPKGHVSMKEFESTLAIAQRRGFEITERPRITRCRAALLKCVDHSNEQ